MSGRQSLGRRIAVFACATAIAAASVGPATGQIFDRDVRPFQRLAALFDRLRPGQSLLQIPVPGGILTSDFGMRRNPVLGGWRLHAGIDISAPRGTPIQAAGDGVVISAEWEAGYGYTTRILHTDGLETMYAHQSAIANWVAVGVRVRQGDLTGTVGTTGSATGPHLHYEVWVDGEPVDPLGAGLMQAGLIGG